MYEYERGDLTKAVMIVLRNSREPLSSYEVFERLPRLSSVFDAKQVKNILIILAKRHKVKKQSVSEVRGRYKVSNKYWV